MLFLIPWEGPSGIRCLAPRLPHTPAFSERPGIGLGPTRRALNLLPPPHLSRVSLPPTRCRAIAHESNTPFFGSPEFSALHSRKYPGPLPRWFWQSAPNLGWQRSRICQSAKADRHSGRPEKGSSFIGDCPALKGEEEKNRESHRFDSTERVVAAVCRFCVTVWAMLGKLITSRTEAHYD
jgi:hypothetical protein